MSLSDDEVSLVEKLRSARSNAAQWTKIATELRDTLNKLLDARGADQGLTASGIPLFHRKTIKKVKINRAKLEAKYPDVFADVAEPVEEHRLELD